MLTSDRKTKSGRASPGCSSVGSAASPEKASAAGASAEADGDDEGEEYGPDGRKVGDGDGAAAGASGRASPAEVAGRASPPTPPPLSDAEEEIRRCKRADALLSQGALPVFFTAAYSHDRFTQLHASRGLRNFASCSRTHARIIARKGAARPLSALVHGREGVLANAIDALHSLALALTEHREPIPKSSLAKVRGLLEVGIVGTPKELWARLNDDEGRPAAKVHQRGRRDALALSSRPRPAPFPAPSPSAVSRAVSSPGLEHAAVFWCWFEQVMSVARNHEDLREKAQSILRMLKPDALGLVEELNDDCACRHTTPTPLRTRVHARGACG
jgi:hypothetical protein